MKEPKFGCHAKLQHQLEKIAEKRGKDLGEVVNQILTEEVERVEALP